MREWIDLVRAWRALAPDEEAVLATVVATRGSVYRRPGARMLLTRDRWLAGSISGGCLEGDLVSTAFTRTEDGPVVATYDASAPDDVLLGFGLGCNGAVDVLMQRLPEDGGALAILERVLQTRETARLSLFTDGNYETSSPNFPAKTNYLERGSALLVETLEAPPALTIFGAGHDAIPLARTAVALGWHTTVVDARSSYAKAERFPGATVRHVRAVDPVKLEKGSAVVLMTHSFANDSAILQWLPEGLGYVGVLGPLHRTERLMQGQSREDLYAPVGLDLGADGPDEIALAIVAEILAVRKGRAAGHLRGRTAIHT